MTPMRTSRLAYHIILAGNRGYDEASDSLRSFLEYLQLPTLLIDLPLLLLGCFHRSGTVDA